MTISDSVFEENGAVYAGGALYVSYGFELSVERTLFRGNYAAAFGGGVYIDLDGQAVFKECNFTGGWGFNGGGGKKRRFLGGGGGREGGVHRAKKKIAHDDAIVDCPLVLVGAGHMGRFRGHRLTCYCCTGVWRYRVFYTMCAPK